MSEELALLAKVNRLLEESPPQAPPSEDGLVEDLLRLREEIPTAKADDKPALLMQYEVQLAQLEQLRSARQRTEVNPESPYFAHLRLEEEGRVRDLCLGKGTRVEAGLRIVDWRNAPISKVYYRYKQGEEYDEELGDRVVSGRVLARRTVTIRNKALDRVDSPEATWVREGDTWSEHEREAARMKGGQGSAVRAWGAGEGEHRRLGTDLEGSRKRVDKRLPDIAGLIDAEQFEVITRPTSGLVVVRGSAGSGKTTVALHRIAWMAYQDATVDSNRTMFVVFSKALRDYVGHVLPALGVRNALVTTYQEWASELRKRHFPRLPREVRDDTPALVVRLKLHPVMLRALEEQVARAPGEPNGEQAMDDWMSATTNAGALERIVEEDAPGAFSREEILKVTTWQRDRNDELVLRFEGEKDVQAAIDEEDEPLLLRAWQLRVGALRGRKKTPLTYRHVAIDEVQDLSPLEVRVLLGCLDRHQSLTLAGDTQQHILQEAGFTSWSDFFRHLGLEGTEVSTLRVAYRSTRQIVEFSTAVLGDLREDEPPVTTRGGPDVELFRFTDHGAAVGFLAEALKDLVKAEPLASVALLTPIPELSALYFDGLRKAEVPRLRRVEDQDFTFAPGVEITEVEQVKGLEFDYVVLIEASIEHFPDLPAARRLLHVGATRAVHQLWLTSVATPSAMVRDALGESD